MNKATYNITDDRFKLWLDERLSNEDYQRTKKLGLSWFPGQKCFSGVWSPSREDFLLEFVEEIRNDENPDDLESRIARFQRYAANDERDAAYAQDRAANATTDRKLRIANNTAENKLAEAEYWQRRIAGAIRHAAYKDKPDVIARRIKKLEAAQRKHTKEQKESRAWLSRWERIPGNIKKNGNPVTMKEAARYFANYDSVYFQIEGKTRSAYTLLENGEIDPESVRARAIEKHTKNIDFDQRWLDHLAMRLEYERAYLAAVAGEETAQALTAPQPRRVSKAPDDGLKKGDIVTKTIYHRGKNIAVTGPIVRLYAKTVHIGISEDHELYDYCQKYEGGVYKAGRKFVHKVEKES